VLTTDVLFHLQFTGTWIFHSWQQLICRFIQSGAGTALNGSILAASLGERHLAEHMVQGGSKSQPQILCPKWATRPTNFPHSPPKSMLFSPDSFPILGQERFPPTFVARVSHVIHMGWPGLTFGLLPALLCWRSQCSVQPGLALPPPRSGGAHPSTESGGWIYIMATLRWLLQETLLPSVRWVLATWQLLASLEPQRQSQARLTGDPSLASRCV